MHKKIAHSQKSNHWIFNDHNCVHKNLRADSEAKHFPDVGAVMDTMNIRHIHPYKMMSSNANHGGECSMCRSVVQVLHMS